MAINLLSKSINCNEELKRLPEANYELCTAPLIILLRGDHFYNGSFERRCMCGRVQPIIDRMISQL